MPSSRAVLLVLAIVAAYGAIEAYPLLAGPMITLTAPGSGEATTDPVTITGRVARASALSLDGAPVIPDENGSFVKVLAFPEGSSILELTARDRFGRSTTLTRTIVVE